MTNTPRHLRAVLAFALIWGQTVPAFAAEFEATPGPRVIITPIAPGLNGIVSPNLQPTLEIPALPQSLPLNGSIELTNVTIQQQTASLSASASAAAVQAAQTVQTARTAPVLSATKIPQAASSEKSFLGRVTEAVGSAILGRGGVTWTKIFDSAAPAGAMGIRPLPKPNLPDGFNLGDAPKTPDPKKIRTVEINALDIPGARTAGGVFDTGPKVLQANTTGKPEEIEANVKEALLKMVDADAAKWGVTRSELKEVHVRYVKGEGNQADTVYAYFEQQREITTKNADGSTEKRTVPVNGTSLSFNVKIVKNQPILMAAMAKLYPNLNVNTTATKTNDELKQSAERQLPQGSGIELVFSESRVVFHEGSWHAVNLYDIEGLPQAVGVKVAIDIASGEIFAWDTRVGLTEGGASTDAAASGVAQAPAESSDHRNDDGSPCRARRT